MEKPLTDPKETILLVDDEAGIRNLLSISLADEGYEVVTAADGREALVSISSVMRSARYGSS